MLNFIWYTLLIILIIIGINIIIDYKRYGKKIFDCFKKRTDEVKMNELLINIFKREIRDKVIIIERSDNYFIAATKFDIFLVQLASERGTVIGKIDDSFLKIKNHNIKELDNFLLQFTKEAKLLLGKNFIIKPIIIKTNNDCILNLSNFDKRNIYSLDDFSYLLYKLQHSTFKYSENELDEVVLKIKGLLDGNN